MDYVEEIIKKLDISKEVYLLKIIDIINLLANKRNILIEGGSIKYGVYAKHNEFGNIISYSKMILFYNIPFEQALTKLLLELLEEEELTIKELKKIFYLS